MTTLNEDRQPPCPKCIDKWGQMPSAWGDSVEELAAYQEHLDEHVVVDQ